MNKTFCGKMILISRQVRSGQRGGRRRTAWDGNNTLPVAIVSTRKQSAPGYCLSACWWKHQNKRVDNLWQQVVYCCCCCFCYCWWLLHGFLQAKWDLILVLCYQLCRVADRVLQLAQQETICWDRSEVYLVTFIGIIVCLSLVSELMKKSGRGGTSLVVWFP